MSDIAETCPVCGLTREQIEDKNLTCKQAQRSNARKAMHRPHEIIDDGECLICRIANT